MKRQDFNFFIGWSIATLVATLLLNLIAFPMKTIGFGLHITAGIISIVSAVATVILIVWKCKAKRQKDNDK